MKEKEIKEVNNSLPKSFQNCVMLLENEVQKGTFTAWSVGNTEYLVSGYWADEAAPFRNGLLNPQKNSYGFHPCFDLASLTKPFFLNCFLRFKWGNDFHAYATQPFSKFEWKTREWNSNLLKFVNANQTLTFDTFLSHKSHFKAWHWVKQFISVRESSSLKEDFLNLLLTKYHESIEPVYSDLNYMFLPLLIESLFDDIRWPHEIEKMNVECGTNFFHAILEPQKAQYAIPSFPYYILDQSVYTSRNQEDVNQHIKLGRFFGVVHDTNANLLASLSEDEKIISGHAGFYGSIVDVFLRSCFLQKTQPTDLIFEKIHETGLPRKKNPFLFGLEYEEDALGHYGYTGTSFWFHPSYEDKKLFLLTNRTATRKSKTDKQIPRIYTITNIRTKNTIYFMNTNYVMQRCDQDVVLKKLSELFDVVQKSWDDTQIPVYANLSEVRKKIETEIW